MMIIGLFRYISGQLSNLDFLFEIFLKAAIEDFSLTWLESVHEIWNASHTVVNGEVNQVLVNEISIRKLLYVKVDKAVRIVGSEPCLSFIGQFRVEQKSDFLQVLFVPFNKLYFVALEI